LIFFCVIYRNIDTYRFLIMMDLWKGKTMEFLIPVAGVAVWLILQVWVLPRLGFQT
jgi:hypothetical protein